MSTRAEYTLEDVVENEEIMQDIQETGESQDLPEAELRLLSGEDVAVTAPGVSLAASLDRFKGPMTPALGTSLNGFYGEFRENPGEAIVIVDEELKSLLGDEAVARFPEDDAGYAVDVRTPGEVVDTVDKYDGLYAGDLSGDFRDAIDNHRIAVPALYDETGVISETPVALMNTEGVAASDRNPEMDEMLGVELEGEYRPDSIDVTSSPAPESEEAERYVDVLLPQQFEEVNHRVHEGDLYVQVDNTIDSQDVGELEVTDAYENNGVYTLELQ